MPRRKDEEKPDWETSNVGLMMFTSLMIILLAFFILLSSMAVIDEQRQMEAMGSVLGAFGLLPGGLDPSSGDKRNIAPPTSPMESILNDIELVKEVLNQRIIEQKVRFLKGRNTNIISLESALLFPPDGVELLPEMLPALMEVCKIFKTGDYPIVIEGHTDDQPPKTEAFQNNWQISALRAVNVLRFMVEDGGIDPKRLSAFGYGGYHPMVVNNSPRNRARNNRIDLVIDRNRQKLVENWQEKHDKDKYVDYKGFIFRLFDRDGQKD